MGPIDCALPRDAELPPCDERIAALHAYWRRIRPADGRLPGRQHVDPVAIPRLLPWVWMVDVQQAPRRFKYRLIGTEVVRAMGCDQTGKWIDEAYRGWEAGATYPQFLAAAEGMICYRRGAPVVHVPKEYLLTERLLLPLARDGTAVDMLLALTLYRSAGAMAAQGAASSAPAAARHSSPL
jgi:hypothetical protein